MGPLLITTSTCSEGESGGLSFKLCNRLLVAQMKVTRSFVFLRLFVFLFFFFSLKDLFTQLNIAGDKNAATNQHDLYRGTECRQKHYNSSLLVILNSIDDNYLTL